MLGDRETAPDREMPTSSEYHGMSNRNRNLRLVVVFQKDTRVPVYFRYVPDRLLQASSLGAVNRRMESLGIGANFTLMDSECCNPEDISRMCENGIQFTMMVPGDSGFLDTVAGLFSPDTVMSDEVCLRDGMEFRVSGTEYRLANGRICHIYAVEIPQNAKTSGEPRVRFIVTSNRMDAEEAVSICYVRKLTDDLLTTTEDYAGRTGRNVTPTAIRGHMIVSFIAASLIQMLRNDLHDRGIDPMDAYSTLKNQKCKVFKNRVVPTRLTEPVRGLYAALGMDCPGIIPRKRVRALR